MFGIFLVSTATLFSEVSNSIGKDQVKKHHESIYTMGFLNLFFGVFIFFFYAFFVRGEFVFALASLPTFGLRAILEIVQSYATVHAITMADRTTFGFLRIVTIPLLLIVDVFLKYQISPMQILGITIMTLTLIFLLMNHGISRKAAGWVLFTAINAVITVALYKYNISHFNSVEAEQGIIYIILMIYFWISARYISKEKPLHYLKKKVFLIQSGSQGVSGVLFSFAFAFAPASIIMSAKRATTILWSIISGRTYFNEKRPLVKMAAFVLIVIGLVLLI